VFAHLNYRRDSIVVGTNAIFDLEVVVVVGMAFWRGNGRFSPSLMQSRLTRSQLEAYHHNIDEQNGQEVPPCPLCITQPAAALPSSATSQFCYVNSFCRYRYVEADTEYKRLAKNDTIRYKLVTMTRKQET
jgi:hypothetical protein